MSDNKEISIKSLFSFEHCLECIAALIAAAGLLGVLQTFVIGKHFLIPTIILSAVLLFGNLAWWGLQGQRWAKYFLFWGAFLLMMHGFFCALLGEKISGNSRWCIRTHLCCVGGSASAPLLPIFHAK